MALVPCRPGGTVWLPVSASSGVTAGCTSVGGSTRGGAEAAVLPVGTGRSCWVVSGPGVTCWVGASSAGVTAGCVGGAGGRVGCRAAAASPLPVGGSTGRCAG
jgi:hypothetical protein